jgi:hypothetical protein
MKQKLSGQLFGNPEVVLHVIQDIMSGISENVLQRVFPERKCQVLIYCQCLPARQTDG